MSSAQFPMVYGQPRAVKKKVDESWLKELVERTLIELIESCSQFSGKSRKIIFEFYGHFSTAMCLFIFNVKLPNFRHFRHKKAEIACKLHLPILLKNADLDWIGVVAEAVTAHLSDAEEALIAAAGEVDKGSKKSKYLQELTTKKALCTCLPAG
jgi:hypothetical protein